MVEHNVHLPRIEATMIRAYGQEQTRDMVARVAIYSRFDPERTQVRAAGSFLVPLALL